MGKKFQIFFNEYSISNFLFYFYIFQNSNSTGQVTFSVLQINQKSTNNNNDDD